MMKLFEYFGWVGIGSIGLAAGVWVGMAAAFRRGRFDWAVGAVGMAILALVFAQWNSARITAIEPDPKEAAEAVATAIESGRTGSIYEQAAREEPLYRRRGTQRRIGTEAAVGDDRFQSGLPADWNPLNSLPQEAEPAPAPRYLPQAELKTANRWDILNLFFARLTSWGALPLLAFLYLRRFNARQGNPFPLPISGRWTEMISPPEALCSIPEGLTATLNNIARRGETFLCMAPRPASLGRLWRLRIGQWGWWELATDDAPPLRHGADLEFLFEALWFNRMAFFLPDREQAPFVLEYLHYLLANRAQFRAIARTPVTIVIPASVAECIPQWESFVDLTARTGIRIYIDPTPSH